MLLMARREGRASKIASRSCSARNLTIIGSAGSKYPGNVAIPNISLPSGFVRYDCRRVDLLIMGHARMTAVLRVDSTRNGVRGVAAAVSA